MCKCGEWKKIETAPRDGTRVLIFGGTCAYGDSYLEYELTEPTIAHWEKLWDCWNCGNAGGHDQTIACDNPTHWMPLPAAPGQPQGETSEPVQKMHTLPAALSVGPPASAAPRFPSPFSSDKIPAAADVVHDEWPSIHKGLVHVPADVWKQVVDELDHLRRAYVGLLENGRDRIISLGGDCDSLERMERGDPALRSAVEALAAAKSVGVGS